MACHPLDRRRAAAGSPRATSARRGRCTPTSGSSSRRRERPDVGPGSGRRRPARHGHLPAHLRPPHARPVRDRSRRPATLADSGIDLDVAVAGPSRGRRRVRADHVDDVGQPADRHDRHRPGAARRSRATSTTRRTPCGRRSTASRERFEPPSPVLGTGLGNEAAHVQDCLRDGLSESPLVPHAQTLELLGVMDDVRAPARRALPPTRRGPHPGVSRRPALTARVEACP